MFRVLGIYNFESHLKMGFPNPLEAENFFIVVGDKAPKYWPYTTSLMHLEEKIYFFAASGLYKVFAKLNFYSYG